MEQQIWSHCEHTLKTLSPNATDNKPLLLQTLASVQSLITNPSTSDSTVSAVFDTLTRSLQLSRDPLVLRHVLSLLRDLAVHRTHLSQLVFNSVRASSFLFTESTRLAAEALSVLVSISELDRALVSSMDEFGDGFFVSLCFRPCVSVRSWLLSNVDRFPIKPYLLLTVLLGFTKDPYPNVRRVALEGLVRLSKSIVCDDRGVIEGCYCRAIELLQDVEDCVRSAAVRAVGGWWQLHLASNQDKDKRDWSDALFVKLCSMVRDMSVEVRVEALDALGKIETVSGDILQQTLSKKVLEITKERKSLNKCTMELFGISAGDGAGAFVHGLEDEFFEVRGSACRSLRMLPVPSAKFSCDLLNLLMGMLNDDSMAVRLEALEVMHHMATSNCLQVQETHMHMFLGTLVDSDTSTRSAARKILRSIKLPNMDMFKSSLDGLIKNLEIYPQDEADVFSILFSIGLRHGKFAICIIKDVYHEIEPPCEGKLRSNSARMAALLVLAISASLSCDENVWSIPPRIYSYAVTLLGRISHALSDVVNQNTLLAHLSHCSKFTKSASEFQKEESKAMKGGISDFTRIEISTSGNVSVRRISDGPSEIQSETRGGTLTDLTEYVKIIFSKVGYIWPLIQSGHMVEVLRTLRTCKEDLATFATDSLKNAGVLAFTLQYLRVVKLLTKVWVHFLPKRKLHNHIMGEVEFVLGKLDNSLREMRYRFMGLSEEEELHVLELVLLTCILRLSEIDVCQHTTLKKLSTIVSRAELLHGEGFVEPSKFFTELKKLLCKSSSTSDNEASCNPLLLKKLIEFFCLKQFVFRGRLEYLKAELEVPDNDSENPLPFISGLPVGIPCSITLHNILSKNRLWLRMTVDEVKSQFVYLDLNQFGSFGEVRNFTYIVPFYNTPKAISFTLRVSIVMECLFENVYTAKGVGRPKYELTCLCKDVEVFLSNVAND